MTDVEIVNGLKSGASEAFKYLYEAHGRGVLTYLTRILGRKEMAEELTQETFLMVIRKIGFFRHREDGGLKAWVFRIATHQAFDVLRREKRIELSGDEIKFEMGPDLAEALHAPEKAFELGQLTLELKLAVDQLTAPQRMAFLLMEQEEMTCLEISRVLGCSENAVKQGVYRARMALRKKLCL